MRTEVALRQRMVQPCTWVTLYYYHRLNCIARQVEMYRLILFKDTYLRKDARDYFNLISTFSLETNYDLLYHRSRHLNTGQTRFLRISTSQDVSIIEQMKSRIPRIRFDP